MQKLPKLDRDTLLKRRYEFMREAWELDGRTSVGFYYKDLLKYARQMYAENGNTKTADDLLKLNTFDVCHLNHRTNTGEFDGLEWLATASRLEHNWMDGKEPVFLAIEDNAPIELTAEEYKYLFLHLLRKSTKNRWDLPRKLIEKKITPERIKIIQEIE